jgi:hypothetical protein
VSSNPTPPLPARAVPELWRWLRSLPAAVRVRALGVAVDFYFPGDARCSTPEVSQ